MAASPHHAAERYVHRAACAHGLSIRPLRPNSKRWPQGQPAQARHHRVITPGTVLEEGMLAARFANKLAGAAVSSEATGLGDADVQHGEFQVSERGPRTAVYQSCCS